MRTMEEIRINGVEAYVTQNKADEQFGSLSASRLMAYQQNCISIPVVLQAKRIKPESSHRIQSWTGFF